MGLPGAMICYLLSRSKALPFRPMNKNVPGVFCVNSPEWRLPSGSVSHNTAAFNNTFLDPCVVGVIMPPPRRYIGEAWSKDVQAGFLCTLNEVVSRDEASWRHGSSSPAREMSTWDCKLSKDCVELWAKYWVKHIPSDWSSSADSRWISKFQLVWQICCRTSLLQSSERSLQISLSLPLSTSTISMKTEMPTKLTILNLGSGLEESLLALKMSPCRLTLMRSPLVSRAISFGVLLSDSSSLNLRLHYMIICLFGQRNCDLLFQFHPLLLRWTVSIAWLLCFILLCKHDHCAWLIMPLTFCHCLSWNEDWCRALVALKTEGWYLRWTVTRWVYCGSCLRFCPCWETNPLSNGLSKLHGAEKPKSDLCMSENLCRGLMH